MNIGRNLYFFTVHLEFFKYFFIEVIIYTYLLESYLGEKIMYKIILACAICLSSVSCAKYINKKKTTTNSVDYANYDTNKHRIKAKLMKRTWDVSDREVEEYLNRVSKRIVLISDTPTKNIQVKLVDDEKANAFKEENNIYMSKGLLKKLENEAELASILSYMMVDEYDEITNHKVKAMKKDKKAISYVKYAGYAPEASYTMQNRLKNESEEFFNETYPVFEERIEETQKNSAKSQKGLKVGEDVYLEMTGNL